MADRLDSVGASLARCSLDDMLAAETFLLESAEVLGDDGTNDISESQARRVAGWLGREIARRERIRSNG